MKAHSQSKRDLLINLCLKSGNVSAEYHKVGMGYSTATSIMRRFRNTNCSRPPGKSELRKSTEIEEQKDRILGFLDSKNGYASGNEISRHMLEMFKFKRDGTTYTRSLKKWGRMCVNHRWVDAPQESKKMREHRDSKLSPYDDIIVELKMEGNNPQQIADYLVENFDELGSCDQSSVRWRLNNVLADGLQGAGNVAQSSAPPEVEMENELDGEAGDGGIETETIAAAVEPVASGTEQMEADPGTVADVEPASDAKHAGNSGSGSDSLVGAEDVSASSSEQVRDGGSVSESEDGVDESTVCESSRKTNAATRKIDHLWPEITRLRKDGLNYSGIAKELQAIGESSANETAISRQFKDRGIENKRGRKSVDNKPVTVHLKHGKPVDIVLDHVLSLNVVSDIDFEAYTDSDIQSGLAGFKQRLMEVAEKTGLTDPRAPNAKHNMFDILTLVMFGVASKRNNIKQIRTFLKENQEGIFKALDLKHGLPSISTFRKVMSLLDPIKLGLTLCTATARIDPDTVLPIAVALDGKALRKAVNIYTRKVDGLLTAFVHNQNQVIGVIPCGKGGEELENLRILVSLIMTFNQLPGLFITADALHGDKKSLIALHNMGANYCFAIKRNKRKLYREIMALIERTKKKAHFARSEENRGRNEARSCQTYMPDGIFMDYWVNDHFKGEETIPEIGMIVHATSVREGKDEEKVVIVSKELEADVAYDMIRKHWGVENKVHYVADKSIKEDEINTRTGNTALNIGIILRAILNPLERFMPGKRNSDKMDEMSCNIKKCMALIAHDYITSK